MRWANMVVGVSEITERISQQRRPAGTVPTCGVKVCKKNGRACAQRSHGRQRQRPAQLNKSVARQSNGKGSDQRVNGIRPA